MSAKLLYENTAQQEQRPNRATTGFGQNGLGHQLVLNRCLPVARPNLLSPAKAVQDEFSGASLNIPSARATLPKERFFKAC